MELIGFLIFLIKVFGLIFVIGILANLILDIVIITPIETRLMEKRKRELFDILIKKIEKGEEIPSTIEFDVNSKKIED